MQIPTFPECDHNLVKSLIHHSDYALVDMLQKSPTDGKYFTALFCRYSPVVYSLIRHSAKSPVQADYLFALTWRHILNELSGIDLSPIRARQQAQVDAESEAEANAISRDLATEFSLQGWLINLTAAHINQAVLPDVESIHYSLSDAPPPLWCYTERALDSLSPMHRLIVLMAQTFEWSDTRIAAYLQAEGKHVSPADVQVELQAAYQSLERSIPEDVRAIYLDKPPVLMPSSAEAVALQAFAGDSEGTLSGEPDGLLTIEFDDSDQ